VSEEGAARVRPLEPAVAQLDSIPRVGRRTAEALGAEVGVDMGRFPSAGQLAAWAGMASGSDVSAGKRRSGKTRTGSPWLRQILVEAAHRAGRTKRTYLGAQFRRLLVRKGKNRAVVAVGHRILVIAYHVLRDRLPLGVNYDERRNQRSVARQLVRRRELLGYDVTLHPTSPAAYHLKTFTAAIAFQEKDWIRQPGRLSLPRFRGDRYAW
jgi:hypothetical protein